MSHPVPPAHALDLYAVLGNPVAHSRSPSIHTRFAELTGQALRYERILVPIEPANSFETAIQAFAARGGRGCNVTVPFKTHAAQLATSRSTRVALAGAANTLIVQADGSLHADNTDGLGLVADITRNAGIPLQGSRVLLVGAGGAAAGVLGPLLQAGAKHITIANRTVAKAQELLHTHSPLAQQLQATLAASTLHDVPGSYDIVINATASSLAGAGVPVPDSVLQPGGLAYDMMYGPAAQPFLDWARTHGATGRDGLGMLVEQAAEAFAMWRGVRPPSAQVLAELQATL